MRNTNVFERMESNVRMYPRDVPMVFDTAVGARIKAEDGREYIDFFAGSGALNYGHNDPRMRDALVQYLNHNGVTHGLDLHTTMKRRFLETIERQLFEPRGWDYKVQFTGPTGADAVEAALKLVRKATGRSKVVSFYGAFHGMTLGALSISGNIRKRGNSVLPDHVIFVPYEDSPHGAFDSMAYLERMVNDQGSGTELPAGVILESIQIQAGVYAASNDFLQRLRKWTKDNGIALILDEIQTGCGRTGDFFGFEQSGIKPDIITCAKSISGYGLPMAIVLIDPEWDAWEPGEHTGTFRGNQLAFLTAQIGLDYWSDPAFLSLIRTNAQTMENAVVGLGDKQGIVATRCHGLIAAIDFGRGNGGLTRAAQQRAISAGLVVERCGPDSEMLKLMPPININNDDLVEGLNIISDAIDQTV
ncbi:diaminobutyrate--2-oxoglutarate transaminase [Mesorhizobium sp. M0965]|uniref:diaminobutyrate--2-oxoglutarate transaminase n=1 Tax=unclassified Mesorhizobium TaxID=325217 RepID=UPI00333722AA